MHKRSFLFVLLALLLLTAASYATRIVYSQNSSAELEFLPLIKKDPAGSGSIPPGSGDWAMVAANPQRTSWSAEEVSGALRVEWYRPIEGYISQHSQIIATLGLIYVSTSEGLYALDAATGAVAWRFDTELPLGNSPTVADGVLYVGGYDRKLHALDARTGRYLWAFAGASAGYDTNPLVVDGRVLLGNRDGAFYAVGAHGTAQAGQLLWKYETGGPIHLSAAYADGVVYFAAGDNRAYALNAASGAVVWRSERLPGEQFHSYWPVIFQDKVIFAGATGYRDGLVPGEASVEGTEREDIWPELQENTTLGPELPPAAWSNGYPIIDANRLTQYLEANPAPDAHKHKPWRRTLIVLNRTNGSEFAFDSDGDGYMEYAPFGWWGAHSGNRYPPLAGPDNVLYSNNPYLCCSDAKGRVMGWQPSLPNQLSVLEGFAALAEPQAISGGGNLIYRNLCCDRVGDYFNIRSPRTRRELWSYDLASRAPGYDQMWTDLPGYPKLHSWYSGTSSSINGAYNSHGDQNPIVPYQGRLYVHRSNAIIAFGPGSGPGLLSVLTPGLAQDTGGQLSEGDLRTRLETEVRKLINAGTLRPGYYNVGQMGLYRELADYFANPGETLLTLSKAYPYLSPDLQSGVRAYLRQEFQAHFVANMVADIGWAHGATREDLLYPPEVAADFANFGEILRAGPRFAWEYPQVNFYAMWKYVTVVPEDTAQAYQLAKSKLQVPLAPLPAPETDYFAEKPYELNGWIAGYMGFLELQERAGMSGVDGALRNQVSNELNRLLQLRAATFDKDSYWQADNFSYKKNLDVARNFIYLVPELADYLAQTVTGEVQAAIAEYEYIAPYWFVSRYEAALGEGASANPYTFHALFLAKAYILNESQAELSKYVDVPAFARGDLFYIQNLVAALEAP